MSEPLLMISLQSLRLFVVARFVREVLGERDWIPIPGTRHEMPGVIGWGRRAVAMLDLARMGADLRPLQVGEKRARMLLLQVSDSNLAIPADSVSSILDVDSADIRPRALTDFPLCPREVHWSGEVFPLFDPNLLVEQARPQ